MIQVWRTEAPSAIDEDLQRKYLIENIRAIEATFTEKRR